MALIYPRKRKQRMQRRKKYKKKKKCLIKQCTYFHITFSNTGMQCTLIIYYLMIDSSERYKEKTMYPMSDVSLWHNLLFFIQLNSRFVFSKHQTLNIFGQSYMDPSTWRIFRGYTLLALSSVLSCKQFRIFLWSQKQSKKSIYLHLY